jgi:predicted lipoprotein with Yx(FWY)xxD motif
VRRFLLLTTALTATATLLAACGDDGGSSESSTTDATDTTDAPVIDDNTGTGDTGGEEGSATVGLDDAGVLVDAEGFTLYVFDDDDGTTSACEGACLDIWPALTVAAEPIAGEGVDGTLLNTAEQADGRVQVTYNGHLLYTYANDTEPGQTNGDGVGGVWHVIDSAGNPVT